jgi:hypothetical protein
VPTTTALAWLTPRSRASSGRGVLGMMGEYTRFEKKPLSAKDAEKIRRGRGERQGQIFFACFADFLCELCG